MKIETALTKLFSIEYPIVQGGMIWVSGWKLAAAVSNAGALGLIGGGSMEPELFREHIRKCRQATRKPFGVNIPLISKYAEQLVQVTLEEKVPIVFTSAGNPAKFTERLKAEGATVVHVIANVRFARKAEAAGVDAVVAEGFEAGGHNGLDEITTLVLVPQVVDAVNIPVIAAGGIADGRGMCAALALGAAGVQIGTRFAASEESSAHPKYKQAIVEADDTATALIMKKLIPVRLIKNKFYQEIKSLEEKGASITEMARFLGKGRARQAIFEGDLEEGEIEVGQAAGLIRDILPAGEIVKRLVQEYQLAKSRLP